MSLIATGVVDTCVKFAAGVVTGGKFAAGVGDTGGKFITGVVSVVHLDLRISPRIFEKILNDPIVIFRGLGGGR